MKSKPNLTRFNIEKASRFAGWRLSVTRSGSRFTRYFSDKQFGSGKKSLAAAEKALVELLALIEGARRVEGRLPQTTVKKAEKILAGAE